MSFPSEPPDYQAVLDRVVRVATVDGRLLLAFAGTFAFLAALANDLPGAFTGCLVAGAGALELHGAHRLRHGDPGGFIWLPRSQALILGAILLYVAVRLLQFNPADLERGLTPAMETRLADANMTRETFLALAAKLHTAFYVFIAFITVLYQGGLILYYRRRKLSVYHALVGYFPGGPDDPDRLEDEEENEEDDDEENHDTNETEKEDKK